MGQLKLGMHVLQTNGQFGVITGWKIIPGSKVMYNLEVAQDHTFVVGQGQWVVHNDCGSGPLRRNMMRVGVTFFSGQNPHHIIPCKLADHGLIIAAGNLFDINAAYNGRALWSKAFSNEAFNAMEPYHANSPGYANRAEALMDATYLQLPNTNPLRQQMASDALMGIIDQLNGWIDHVGLVQGQFGVVCSLDGTPM